MPTIRIIHNKKLTILPFLSISYQKLQEYLHKNVEALPAKYELFTYVIKSKAKKEGEEKGDGKEEASEEKTVKTQEDLRELCQDDRKRFLDLLVREVKEVIQPKQEQKEVNEVKKDNKGEGTSLLFNQQKKQNLPENPSTRTQLQKIKKTKDIILEIVEKLKTDDNAADEDEQDEQEDMLEKLDEVLFQLLGDLRQFRKEKARKRKERKNGEKISKIKQEIKKEQEKREQIKEGIMVDIKQNKPNPTQKPQAQLQPNQPDLIKRIILQPKPSQSPSQSSQCQILCKQCKTQITSPRFKCPICEDYNLCQNCQAGTQHQHPLLKIRRKVQGDVKAVFVMELSNQGYLARKKVGVEKKASLGERQLEQSIKKVSSENKQPQNLQKPSVQPYSICHECSTKQIIGTRFKCALCKDYTICEACQNKSSHPHPLLKIKKPLNNPIRTYLILQPNPSRLNQQKKPLPKQAQKQKQKQKEKQKENSRQGPGSEQKQNYEIKEGENLGKKMEELVHQNLGCCKCGVKSIVGVRYRCSVCQGYDVCGDCESKVEHQHPLLKIQKPIKNQIKIYSNFNPTPPPKSSPNSSCQKCQKNFPYSSPNPSPYYKCPKCPNFQLCQSCEPTLQHEHSLLKIKTDGKSRRNVRGDEIRCYVVLEEDLEIWGYLGRGKEKEKEKEKVLNTEGLGSGGNQGVQLEAVVQSARSET